MKQVTLLPLNSKVLTEEQKIILINTALQTLFWISPLLNPNLGQVEPPDEYKRDGMLAYADGTNWNPISGGKGNYRWNATTTSWEKIEGSGGGSGDMLKSTYDPNTDGVIALAQLDTLVSTFKQTDHDALPNPHHSNSLDHANTNDPSTDQKAALAGTSGTPSGTNKYVTNDDARNSDARTPTAHNQDASTINSGTLDGDRLPALSTAKKGAVPATGTPSGKYLKDDGTWNTPSGSGGIQVMHIQDQKTNGTDGGSSVAGIQTRVFNTVVVNEISGASLASNQLTLPAGKYLLWGRAPARGSDRHKCAVYNTTTSAYIAQGCSALALIVSGALTQSDTIVSGVITLAAASVLELRHFIQVALSGSGLGIASSSGLGNEVYAEMLIEKLS